MPAATCRAGADIAFDEPLYVAYAPGESEYETPTIRVGYASMLTPDSIYDYHLTTGELTLLKRTPVLDDPRFGPYQPENYIQERGWATAPDGTQVPLSIVRRADVPLDGSAPALLYGYGAYEASDGPRASPSRGSRCSTVASSTPSPTSAAGASWAGAGTSRARRSPRGTPSPTSSPARTTPGAGIHLSRPVGRPRRERRRPADGCRRQPRAGEVPRHPCRGAVRRRADHDPQS